jgi:hypothetical protein
MIWIITLMVAGLATTAAIALRVNALRFGVRVGREAQALWPAQLSAAAIEPDRVDQLPDPVKRYLRKAIARERHSVTTAQLTHGGTFRPKLDGAWLAIHGSQYIRADPPAFVWWGRVRVAPGVWIDARDRFEGGRGNMLVMMDSTFTLANSAGSAIDQGALLRLLAEMVWLPSAFLEARISWRLVDDRRAEARLRVDDLDVTGTFEFGADDLPAGFRALRYRDLGGGKAELSEFYGSMSDYREVDGLLVPHLLIAHWKIGDELVPYARFAVESIVYDQPLPQ